MSIYYYNIDIKVKPLIYDVESAGGSSYLEKIPVEHANPDLITLLSKCNIVIYGFNLFRKNHQMSNDDRIHTDSHNPGNFVNLNWIYGGSGSYMCWYDTFLPGKKETYDIDIHYISYARSEVNFLYKENLTGVCIVQAGIPHNIIMGKEPRVCLSAALYHKHIPSKRISMDDCQKLLAAINL